MSHLTPPSTKVGRSRSAAPASAPKGTRRTPSPLTVMTNTSVETPTATMQLHDLIQQASKLTSTLNTLIEGTRKAEEERKEEWKAKMEELDLRISSLKALEESHLFLPPSQFQSRGRPSDPLLSQHHDSDTQTEQLAAHTSNGVDGQIGNTDRLDEVELDEEQIQSVILEMKVCSTTTGTWDKLPDGSYRCVPGGHTLTLEEITKAFRRSSRSHSRQSSDSTVVGDDNGEVESGLSKDKFQEMLKRLSNCPEDGDWLKRKWGYICAGGGHVVKIEKLRQALLDGEDGEDSDTPTPTPTPPRESTPTVDQAPVVAAGSRVTGQGVRPTEAQIQLAIQKLARCSDNRPWAKVVDGYRCEGEGHFISNAELGI